MKPFIANLSIKQLNDLVNGFSKKYVDDWNCWLNTYPDARPRQLGIILRKWQACRPNRMRRTRSENIHDAPYLDDLINQAAQPIHVLENFRLEDSNSFSVQNCQALEKLWNIFQNLPYHGNAGNGHVGVSKATLLLTNGRVGPAFDSTVKKYLDIKNISNANEWINALKKVSQDIRSFEDKNQTKIQQAVPNYVRLHSGRIYDMALGPRAKV